ncbi:hypothetical protein pb186bvf_019941 [Paramecium bursaria]
MLKDSHIKSSDIPQQGLYLNEQVLTQIQIFKIWIKNQQLFQFFQQDFLDQYFYLLENNQINSFYFNDVQNQSGKQKHKGDYYFVPNLQLIVQYSYNEQCGKATSSKEYQCDIEELQPLVKINLIIFIRKIGLKIIIKHQILTHQTIIINQQNSQFNSLIQVQKYADIMDWIINEVQINHIYRNKFCS